MNRRHACQHIGTVPQQLLISININAHLHIYIIYLGVYSLCWMLAANIHSSFLWFVFSDAILVTPQPFPKVISSMRYVKTCPLATLYKLVECLLPFLTLSGTLVTAWCTTCTTCKVHFTGEGELTCTLYSGCIRYNKIATLQKHNLMQPWSPLSITAPYVLRACFPSNNFFLDSMQNPAVTIGCQQTYQQFKLHRHPNCNL